MASYNGYNCAYSSSSSSSFYYLLISSVACLFIVFISKPCLCQDQPISYQDYPDPDPTKFTPESFDEEAAQTYNLVFHKYNARVRPPRPFVEIHLDVTLTHIRYLDLVRQELQVVLDLQLLWQDSRLRWAPYLVKEIHQPTDVIWCPDLIYKNGIGVAQQLYPNVVKIIHNGTVSWMKKEIVTTRCSTDLSRDSQSCDILIGFGNNNPREPEKDKFFFSDSTSTHVLDDDGIFNHKWSLVTFNTSMMTDNENNVTVTKTSTLDLTLDLEMTRGRKGSGKKSSGSGNKGSHSSSYDRLGSSNDNGFYDYNNGGSSGSSENCGGCSGAVSSYSMISCVHLLSFYVIFVALGLVCNRSL